MPERNPTDPDNFPRDIRLVDWYAIISGEEQGPFTFQHLVHLLVSGKLGWDAYVWHDGVSSWFIARELPELVQAAAQSPQKASSAAPRPSHVQAIRPQAAADDKSQNGSIPLSQDLPRSVEQAMTAARKEDSVLFSLKNLLVLASQNARANDMDRTSSQPPGQVTEDNTGLVDVAALASAAHSPATAQPSLYDGEQRDHPSAGANEAQEVPPPLGSSGERISAWDNPSRTTLPPPARPSYAVPLAILIGFAMVSISIFSAILILRSERRILPLTVAPLSATTATVDQPSAEIASVSSVVPIQKAATVAVEPSPESVNALPVQQPDTEQTIAGQPTEARETYKSKTTDRKKKRSRGQTEKSHVERLTSPAAASGPDTRDPQTEPSASAAKPSSSSSIDELLDSALSASAEKPSNISGSKTSSAEKNTTAKNQTNKKDSAESDPSQPEPASSALPELPNRAQTLAAMKQIEPAVRKCAQRQTGTAMTEIKVSGDTGAVKSVRVTGIEGPAGLCIAREVYRARFPRFSKPVFTVRYPFKL